jgi:hypothetical protein
MAAKVTTSNRHGFFGTWARIGGGIVLAGICASACFSAEESAEQGTTSSSGVGTQSQSATSLTSISESNATDSSVSQHSDSSSASSQDSSSDDHESSGTDSQDSDSMTSSGESEACEGDFLCLPAVDAGWTGYVRWNEATGAIKPDACSGNYPHQVGALLYSGLSADEALCQGCTLANTKVVAPQCGAARLELYDAEKCESGSAQVLDSLALGPTCTNVTSLWKSTDHDASVVEGALEVPAKCQFKATPNESVNPVQWETTSRLCAGTDAAGVCETGFQCTARPDDNGDELCIFRAGDHECPSSGPTQRHLLYTGATDSRACSPCVAGMTQESSTCTTEFYWETWDCDGTEKEALPDESQTCRPYDRGIKYGYSAIVTGATSGKCKVSGGESQGSASESGPQTLCCLRL